MLFFKFFQTLVEKNAQVIVELKNDLEITDQYLNIKLDNISANDTDKYPHLNSVKNCFIRGSVVRYVYLQKHDIDFDKLQDLCRKSTKQQ